jgi:midasin (ATPase involved in ribosome maturation)
MMFICNKSTEGLYNIQEFLESYSENLNKTDSSSEVKFVTMDLFESSDVVDLIGGFEMKASNEDDDAKLFNTEEPAKDKEGAMAAENTEEEIQIGSLFSWKESMLVKAIKNGYWILLRGVESVNSGVLERLNGILEKEEVIWLNEALGDSMEDKKLIKHPNFRVFLQYEEDKGVKTPSRALRNRCIEIRIDNFLLQTETKEDETKEEGKLDLEKLETLNSEIKQDHYQDIVKSIDRNKSQDLIKLEQFNLFERLVSNKNFIQSYLPKFATYE